MAASVMGMLLGRMIAFFWIRVKRGGKKGPYASVAQSEEAAQDDAVKDGLMAAHEEQPPVYEELDGSTVAVPEKEVV